jgi:hypothetical protein
MRGHFRVDPLRRTGIDGRSLVGDAFVLIVRQSANQFLLLGADRGFQEAFLARGEFPKRCRDDMRGKKARTMMRFV